MVFENLVVYLLDKYLGDYIENLDTKKLKIDFVNSEQLMGKMYFIPELNTDDIRYEDLFRITIVSFLDKFNFCTTSVKKSCIHFITDNGKIIPIDTYYLMYQNSK